MCARLLPEDGPRQDLAARGKPGSLAFNSHRLKTAYKRREVITDEEGRTWLSPRKSSKLLSISERTLLDWQKSCPWLGRGITVYPFDCGIGRTDNYCDKSDLDTIVITRSKKKCVPDMPNETPIEDAAKELCFTYFSLVRLCKDRKIPISKYPGQDKLGRAHERAYVPTVFVEAERKRRQGLAENEITLTEVMKILDCKQRETVLKLVRSGQLPAEKMSISKGPGIAPGAAYIFDRAKVERFQKNTPLKAERIRRARAKAEDFLSRRLADGEWHQCQILKKEAARLGIQKKPLFAAIKELRVEKRNALHGRGPGFWRLVVLQGAGHANAEATAGQTQPSHLKPTVQPKRGRPPGSVDSDVQERKRLMLEAWERQDYGDNKARYARQFNFHRQDASKIINSFEAKK